MKYDRLFTIGSIVLGVILIGLLACEVLFPLSGTTLIHKIMG